jgi:hypothetical protein
MILKRMLQTCNILIRQTVSFIFYLERYIQWLHMETYPKFERLYARIEGEYTKGTEIEITILNSKNRSLTFSMASLH